MRFDELAEMQELLTDLERPRERNLVANGLAAVLDRHYGPLPLSVRYGAALAAVDQVEASRAQHATWLREQIAKSVGHGGAS